MTKNHPGGMKDRKIKKKDLVLTECLRTKTPEISIGRHDEIRDQLTVYIESAKIPVLP